MIKEGSSSMIKFSRFNLHFSRILGLFQCLKSAARTAVLIVCPLSFAQQTSFTNPDLNAGITNLDIAPVWSGHPVGFALLTHGDQQYVAYYAADRQMTVAQRTLGERRWHYTILPTAVGWDSHNYVTMALDRKGYLHVSGNMHRSPLIYFRSTKPGDSSSLVHVLAMTGRNESQVTYPFFFKAPDGALLFEYRSGFSGAGDTYWTRYDERTERWSPISEQPLFEGGSLRNAYPMDPVYGPDGWYHMVWVWRESPMAETNHDLSYARSRDMIHWETAGGASLRLPLTLSTPGLIVDPSPQHGGLLNGTQTIGFDASGKLVIAYLKYDAKGNTQLYFARWQDGRWNIVQASNWAYRWDFHGLGSLPTDDVSIAFGPLTTLKDKLGLIVNHSKYGSGFWEVDPKTMLLVGKPNPVPEDNSPGKEYAPPRESDLVQNTARDLSGTLVGGASYVLTWNTRGMNRDQARPEGASVPTMLHLLVVPGNSNAQR
jgi:hypothetical protein